MRRILTAALAAFFAASLPLACDDSRSPLPERASDGAFTVQLAIPAPGRTGVPLTARVIFHFNRTIDTAALDPSFASLEKLDEAGEPVATVPIDIQAAGPNVIAAPRKPLEPNTRFRATVTEAVRDARGNAPVLDGGSWSMEFETGAERRLAGVTPAISSAVPAEGETVFDWTTFRFYFSEPLDARSIVYGQHVGLRRQGSGVDRSRADVRERRAGCGRSGFGPRTGTGLRSIFRAQSTGRGRRDAGRGTGLHLYD
ncbi:MAG: Ig-like domain-containing protein [Deltaproteobacteria bacterium]|nr:Ig-like domain-containing protein [Deltaproteobacteria bacterium]